MLDPNQAFDLTGPLVLAGWAALLLSLFVRQVRPIAWPATQFVVPAILAVLYVPLIWAGFGEAKGGGFGSIGEIRALFASDSALVAGWFHYLAFDLFVGQWVAKDADHKGFGRLAQIPFLSLVFLAGPVGLLVWLAVRERRARAIARRG